MAEYTEISCWLRPVQPITPQYSLLQPTTAQFSLVKPSTVQYIPVESSTAHHSPVQPSTVQCSPVQPSTAHHHQCRWKYTTMYTSLHCPVSLLHRGTLVLSIFCPIFFSMHTNNYRIVLLSTSLVHSGCVLRWAAKNPTTGRALFFSGNSGCGLPTLFLPSFTQPAVTM